MRDLFDNIKRTVARAVGIKDEPEPRASRRVLFVCMGNICRSPTAEGVFRKLLAERAPELDVDIDSAGTHGFHDGAPPDPRACRAAERAGGAWVDATRGVCAGHPPAGVARCSRGSR